MNQIASMFAVPYAFAKHPAPGPLNAALKALFLAREAEGQKNANPIPLVARNEAVYESRFNLFEWPDPSVQALRSWCWQQLYAAIGELNGYDRDTLSRLDLANEAWFHITRRGGFFGTHNHAMASWSGVYCVDAGQDDGTYAESGQLTFLHPNPHVSMFMDRAISHLRPPFHYGNRAFSLEAGQLILFPSWMLHEVKPFLGDGTRITVAFNCWFRYREPSPASRP
jgi:hypothetical protein